MCEICGESRILLAQKLTWLANRLVRAAIKYGQTTRALTALTQSQWNVATIQLFPIPYNGVASCCNLLQWQHSISSVECCALVFVHVCIAHCYRFRHFSGAFRLLCVRFGAVRFFCSALLPLRIWRVQAQMQSKCIPFPRSPGFRMQCCSVNGQADAGRTERRLTHTTFLMNMCEFQLINFHRNDACIYLCHQFISFGCGISHGRQRARTRSPAHNCIRILIHRIEATLRVHTHTHT